MSWAPPWAIPFGPWKPVLMSLWPIHHGPGPQYKKKESLPQPLIKLPLIIKDQIQMRELREFTSGITHPRRTAPGCAGGPRECEYSGFPSGEGRAYMGDSYHGPFVPYLLSLLLVKRMGIVFPSAHGRLQCYTKKLDALRRWREMFFWVDDALVPWDFAFYTQGSLSRDERPPPGSYRRINGTRAGANGDVDLWVETQGGATGDDGAGGHRQRVVRSLSIGSMHCRGTSGFLCAGGEHATPVPPQTGPKAFEGMPVDQLMEEFDMVTAWQDARVAHSESKAEAESSRSYAQNLDLRKNDLLVNVEQGVARDVLSQGKLSMGCCFATRVGGGGLLEKQEEKVEQSSIEYDEELYPHMLSAIAERRRKRMEELHENEVMKLLGSKKPTSYCQMSCDQDYHIDVDNGGVKLWLGMPPRALSGQNDTFSRPGCVATALFLSFRPETSPVRMDVPVSVSDCATYGSVKLMGKLEEAREEMHATKLEVRASHCS
ncbi:hypothetical protein Tco_0821361 [Tanacetum coccineum]|uniref:Uncharacterized protein n=1 Tax=Tanacetum coccineum TaxID=301880 RepID=A0ABQ5AF68_9ASTR